MEADNSEYLNNFSEQVRSCMNQLKANVRVLKDCLKISSKRQSMKIEEFIDYTEWYFEWIRHQLDFYAEKVQGKSPECLDLRNLSAFNDHSKIYRYFNIHARMNFPNDVYFTENFGYQLRQLEDLETKKEVICGILELGLNHAKNWKFEDLHSGVMGFSFVTCSGWTLVATFETNKFPLVKKKQLFAIEYSRHFKLIDMGRSEKANFAAKAGRSYLNSFKDPQILHFETHDFFRREKPEVSIVHVNPSDFYYDENNKRWVDKKLKIHEEPNYKVQSNMNSEILNSILELENCGMFISLLKTIPGFNIRLTDQEESLISSPGNVMAIGRSGTGKTTCAMLRLFAVEYLFRAQCKLNNLDKYILTDPRSDFEKKLSLQTVFTTLSPVLIKEVEAYYKKLKDNFLNKCKGQEVEPEEERELEFEEEYSSGIDLETCEFPLFASIRKLLMMVDSTLYRPFFDSKPNESGISLSWGVQKTGFMYVNKVDSWTLKSTKRLCFEVDFDYFYRHFWPKVRMQTSLSALTVWTEMQANIKGDPSIPGIPIISAEIETVYMSMGMKKSFLSGIERKKVFKILIDYEAWKTQIGGYDFQDFVRHIRIELDSSGYTGNRIHFMMVDEVQDCTGNLLKILMKITEQNLFFAGDTAQTIAKGVGFRFCDLRSLFNDCQFERAELVQLSKNFRSHGRILDLGNSVVRLIQALFPETIDPMDPEVSSLDGPKPVILSTNSSKDLEMILLKSQRESSSRIEFGCNQVILVRNDQAKKTLPSELTHALCLTIFESKGLEFEEVIIYNFFTHSDMSNKQWNYIKKLGYADLKVPLLFDKLAFSMLCTELKHLYVAITRAKNRILFFDQQPGNRLPIQEYWEKQNLVGVLNVVVEGPELKIQGEGDLNLNPDNTFRGWHKQGLRLMKNGFYEQARKCFFFSGDFELEKKARAYCLAKEAAQLLTENESISEEIKAGVKKKSKLTKAQIKSNKENSKELFLEAAGLFLELEMFVNAGKCFYSAEQKLKAAEILESSEFWIEAGEVFYEVGMLDRSFENFLKGKSFGKALRCLIDKKEWEACIELLKNHLDVIDEKEHYLNLVLEKSLKALMPQAKSEPKQQEAIEEAIEEDSEEDSEDQSYSQLNEPSLVEESFEHLEDPQKESFEVLSSEKESFEVLSEFDSQTFDLLSDIDPNDEWVLLSNASKKLSHIAESDLSGYSIVEESCNSQGKAIQNKLDLFHQDETMLKVASYFSHFLEEICKQQSEEAVLYLVPNIEEALRKNPSLNFLFEVDGIDVHSLVLILEYLEKHSIYNLCFFVCNRYQLSGLIGRYLVSAAFKYSKTLWTKPLDFRSKNYSKAFMQRAVVAYEAVHSMLEMISPELLNPNSKFRIPDYTLQGMLLLGFWKKIIFILPSCVGVSVSLQYSDYYSFKHHFQKLNGTKLSDGQGFTPQDSQVPELQVHIAEYLLVNFNSKYRLCYSRPTEFVEMDFPESFPLNQVLWSYIAKKGSTQKDLLGCITTCKDFLLAVYRETLLPENNFSAFYDSASFLVQLVVGLEHHASIKSLLGSMEESKKEDFMLGCLILVKMLERKGTRTKFNSMVLKGVLGVLGVRAIELNELNKVLPYSSHFMVSAYSRLWDFSTSNNEQAILVDIEGKNYLLPIKSVVSRFCNQLFKTLGNFVVETLKSKNEKSLEYLCRNLGVAYLYSRILQMFKTCSSQTDLFIRKKPVAKPIAQLTRKDLVNSFIKTISDFLNQIIKKRRQFPFTKVELSFFSKEALLLQAQTLSVNLEDPEVCDKAHKLYEVAGCEKAYTAMVYQRFPESSKDYDLKRDTALIGVNTNMLINCGDLKEAVEMTLSFLEFYPKLDPTISVYLVERCVVCILASIPICKVSKLTSDTMEAMLPELFYSSGPVEVDSFLFERITDQAVKAFKELNDKKELKKLFVLLHDLICNFWEIGAKYLEELAFFMDEQASQETLSKTNPLHSEAIVKKLLNNAYSQESFYCRTITNALPVYKSIFANFKKAKPVTFKKVYMLCNLFQDPKPYFKCLKTQDLKNSFHHFSKATSAFIRQISAIKSCQLEYLWKVQKCLNEYNDTLETLKRITEDNKDKVMSECISSVESICEELTNKPSEEPVKEPKKYYSEWRSILSVSN